MSILNNLYNLFDIFFSILNYILNYNIDGFFENADRIIQFNLIFNGHEFFFIEFNNFLNNYFFISFNFLFKQNNFYYIALFLDSNYLNFFFLIIYFLIIFKIFKNYFFIIFENSAIFFIKVISKFYIILLKFFGEKFESIEEGFLFIKFIPFFIFLFFIHLFYIDNLSYYLIFLEWSLPVLFGILIIIESLWLFSSYIFIYLNGSSNRKIFIITLTEDVINLSILIARILLQMVRGIICGLYHDFFREISMILIFKMQLINHQMLFFTAPYNIFYMMYTVNMYFIIFLIISFTVFLMFLQILFLFLAVWLFCKCWFKSIFYQSKLYIIKNNYSNNKFNTINK